MGRKRHDPATESTPVQLRVPPQIYARLKAQRERDNRGSMTATILDLVIRALQLVEPKQGHR